MKRDRDDHVDGTRQLAFQLAAQESAQGTGEFGTAAVFQGKDGETRDPVHPEEREGGGPGARRLVEAFLAEK